MSTARLSACTTLPWKPWLGHADAAPSQLQVESQEGDCDLERLEALDARAALADQRRVGLGTGTASGKPEDGDLDVQTP